MLRIPVRVSSAIRSATLQTDRYPRPSTLRIASASALNPVIAG